MVEPADFSRPGAVIELGGGTGSITRAILGAGVGYERLFSIEFDPELAVVLRHRFPTLHVVEGNAANLVGLMEPHGVTQAAAVISGLPLLGMPPNLQQAILEGAFHLLGTRGRFIQFTYSPASPVRPTVRKALGLKAFRAGRAFMNLPPARVWCYERDTNNG